MSTHLRRTAAADTPVSESDLVAYFAAGCKPPDEWRVGAEFEKFALDRTTGKQLGFDGGEGIEGILRALAAQFGWEAHEEVGRITTLTRGTSTVSVEPGGQVELSTPPASHISELKAELDRHLAELRALTDPARVAWVAAGVTPFSTVEEITLNPRPRHRLMAEYLPRRCEFGLHMMKATSSTQVTFDFSNEADAGWKFTVALCLSPVVNAAFANGPLCAGKPTGFASFRGRIWQGMDPDRSGFLTELLAGEVTFSRWASFALDVPLLFTEIDGNLRPATGITFREWMNHGLDGRFPTLHDWELHVSTVFTEVRLKRFIEVRGADACPTPLALAVPAVWKGLLYDPESLATAAELARHFPSGELRQLAGVAAKLGLRGEYRGKSLAAWGREVIAIAADGLNRLGGGEAAFLDPLREVLASGRSPGELWPASGDVAGVLAACEYPIPR